MKLFKLPLALLAIALLFVSTPQTASAVDFSMSAGGGGLLGYTFTRYQLKGGNVKSTQSMDRFDYAGLLFFDATFAELSVMFRGGNSTYSENMVYSVDPIGGDKGKGTEAGLGFTLLGKYPFTINEKMSWFPLFGVEYQIALIQKRQPEGGLTYNRAKGELPEDNDKNGKPYPLYAWNAFWIDIGAGLDYNITDAFFLRSELLFGFRLPTIYEMGALELVKKQTGIRNVQLGGLTGNPALKLCAGYRFK